LPRKTHHVVPAPDDGWNVKKGGSDRASKHFDRKEDAIKWGTEVAKNQDSELVIHKRDGSIQNPNSHGNDPNPPRDKKH